MKKQVIKKTNTGGINQNRRNINIWLWILALVIITIWVFSPGLHNQLTNWDDNYYLNQNKNIAPLNFENLKHYFTTFYIGNYHPFTLLAYSIDFHFFKLNPFPYHVINLIFHVLNSILVIFFIQRMTDKFRLSVLCGFLFAVHPLHVESVVWVSERKDVMFMFFYLLGLLSYLRYRDEQKTWFLILAFVAFVFSCLFKAMAVSFPVVLVFVDYLKITSPQPLSQGERGESDVGLILRTSPQRLSQKGERLGKAIGYKMSFLQLLVTKLPFFIISILFGILALLAQKSAAAVNIFTDHTLWDRIVFVSYGLVFYPLKLLVPFQLSPYYPYPEKIDDTLPFHYWIYPVIAILFLMLIFLMFKKNFRLGLFGIFFYLATIIPVIQVVQVGEAIVADRYSYLPSLGIFIVFCYWIEKLFDGAGVSLARGERLGGGEGAGVSLARGERLGGGDGAGVSLARGERLGGGDGAGVSLARGERLGGLGKFILIVLSVYVFWFCLYSRHRCTIWKDSVTLWTDALEQFPHFALGYYNRSNEYIQRGHFELALDDLNKAVTSKPNYAHALNNRGYCLHLLGKNKEAYPDLKRASKLDPLYSDPLNNLGVVCFQLGKPDSAIYYFKKGVEVSPEFGELYKNIGAVYHNTGDYKNAVEYYEKARKFYPEDMNIQMYLAQLRGLLESSEK